MSAELAGPLLLRYPDDWQHRFNRVRRERPSGGNTADNSDKFPSPHETPRPGQCHGSASNRRHERALYDGISKVH
jgi:hypothetical protein